MKLDPELLYKDNCAAFERDHHEWIALRHLITTKEMLHISGFLKYCPSRNLTSGRNNGERNWQLKGYSSRQFAFEDHQRFTNSRWLTDGCENNRNCNFSTWPDSVLTIISLQQFLRWKFRRTSVRQPTVCYLFLACEATYVVHFAVPKVRLVCLYENMSWINIGEPMGG